MEDFFATLSPEEIEENLRLWDQFEEQKTEKKVIKLPIIPKLKIDYLKDVPDTQYGRLFTMGYQQLNDFQKDIFHDCFIKKFGTLALPLGSGKTIISIVLSLYLAMKNENKILIVVSKSLISNWIIEIEKFFGNELTYIVMHQDNIKDISKWKCNTIITLTTIDMLSGSYSNNLINKLFIEQQFIAHAGHLGSMQNFYNVPEIPYLNHIVGTGLFYSIKWGCLIVDEVQNYTNISTLRCQSLGALCVDFRWALSGSPIVEPVETRILGYHIILNIPDVPRNLPQMKEFLRSDGFKGLDQHMIKREKNEAFIPPKVNDIIISHQLTKEEELLYTMMKDILVALRDKAERAKLNNQKQLQKIFNSYKLVMVMYLRQSIICPLVPITSVILDASNHEERSQLADIIIKELNNLHIDYYMNDKNSIKSSRITAVLNVLGKHDNERCIVFSCFVACLDILQYFLQDSNRSIFVLSSDLNLNKRKELLEKFEASNNGILLSTFDLSAEGFNFQYVATLVLIDYFWNSGKTKQAIGRIFRYGQKAEEINIYFFNSNTGIEKIIYEKQNAKMMIVEELRTGKQTGTVPKIKMDDIIKLVEEESNKALLQNINNKIY